MAERDDSGKLETLVRNYGHAAVASLALAVTWVLVWGRALGQSFASGRYLVLITLTYASLVASGNRRAEGARAPANAIVGHFFFFVAILMIVLRFEALRRASGIAAKLGATAGADPEVRAQEMAAYFFFAFVAAATIAFAVSAVFGLRRRPAEELVEFVRKTALALPNSTENLACGVPAFVTSNEVFATIHVGHGRQIVPLVRHAERHTEDAART